MQSSPKNKNDELLFVLPDYNQTIDHLRIIYGVPPVRRPRNFENPVYSCSDEVRFAALHEVVFAACEK